MSEKEKQLLIIVPITRSGLMLDRALESIVPIKDNVYVVASFNRGYAGLHDEATMRLLNALEALTLFPKNRLSPIGHLNYIFRSLQHKLNISKDFATTILSDDDELLLSAKDIHEISVNISKKIAVWGPYETVNMPKGNVEKVAAFFSNSRKDSYSRLERLQDEIMFARMNYESENHIQGSITGLFAPLHAFSSAFMFFDYSYSSYGARIEASILAKRGLQVCHFTKNVARIYLHSEQGGKRLPSPVYVAEELRFRAYAVLNSRGISELLSLFQNGFGPDFFFKSFLRIFYLKFNAILR